MSCDSNSPAGWRYSIQILCAFSVPRATSSAFHPPGYVRDELARRFELVDHVPEGALGNLRQDLFLFRKPLATSSASIR